MPDRGSCFRGFRFGSKGHFFLVEGFGFWGSGFSDFGGWCFRFRGLGLGLRFDDFMGSKPEMGLGPERHENTGVLHL